MQDEHDQGNYQNDVNQPAGDVSHQTQAPEDKQDDGNSKKHMVFFKGFSDR